jgi:hypothetical protein
MSLCPPSLNILRSNSISPWRLSWLQMDLAVCVWVASMMPKCTTIWQISILCLDFPPGTFKINSYNDIHLALCSPQKENKPRKDLTYVALLPFVGPIFSHISRVLLLHNIKTVGALTWKVPSFPWLKSTWHIQHPL